MESIRTAPRIHPLMAAAAASVVIVSLAGTAAITGLLPTSVGATAPQLSSSAPAPMTLAAVAPQQPSLQQQPLPQQQLYVAEPAPAPVVVKRAPVVNHTAPRPRTVHHHHTQVARNDQQRDYYSAPAVQQAPRPAQPNYVGIGLGAVVGGLLGNQVGGGNGRKLATVAGVIGGGMLGNEVANRNR
jgi:uncharacterized protein YcfJ